MKPFRPWLQSLVGTPPTDEQLMWRVSRSDDVEAFEELISRWHAPIHALGTRMLGDPFSAQDIAQEVFQRLHQHRQRYQPSARFSTYLWRIALNRCHDELLRPASRAAWRSDPVDSSDDEDRPTIPSLVFPGPSPDELAGIREEWALVRAALQALSPTLRAVVVLRHYHDLKLREIADVLEIPEGTVCSRLAEALDQLARRLGATATRAQPQSPPTHAPSPRPKPAQRSTPSPSRHD